MGSWSSGGGGGGAESTPAEEGSNVEEQGTTSESQEAETFDVEEAVPGLDDDDPLVNIEDSLAEGVEIITEVDSKMPQYRMFYLNTGEFMYVSRATGKFVTTNFVEDVKVVAEESKDRLITPLFDQLIKMPLRMFHFALI